MVSLSLSFSFRKPDAATENSVEGAAAAKHLQPVHGADGAAAVCRALLQFGVPVQRGTDQESTQVTSRRGYKLVGV